MQVSVGAIKISHAFHFEMLVNVSIGYQRSCTDLSNRVSSLSNKSNGVLFCFSSPWTLAEPRWSVSLVANNSWQAFPKMVPRPRNSCNAIQYSTYPPVVWALSPSRVAGGGGPGILVCRMRALAFVVDVFELCCKGFLVMVC